MILSNKELKYASSELDRLSEEAWELRYVEPESAKLLSEKVIALSKDYASPKAQALITLGVVLNFAGKHDQALEHCFEALSLLDKKPSFWLARGYNLMANIYGALGERVQNLELRLKYLEVAKSLESESHICAAYHNLALYYINDRNIELGLDYFEKGKPYLKDNLINQSNYCLSLGRVHLSEGNIKEAEKFLNSALEISRGNALLPTESSSLLLLSELALKEGDFKKALDLALESQVLNENTKQNMLPSLKQLAEVYFAQNQLDNAKAYLLKILNNEGFQKQKRDLIACYDLIHKICIAQENFEDALNFHKEMYALDKAFFNEQNATRTRALHITHKIKQLDHESKLLSSKNAELERQYDELKELHAKVRELSIRDALTGLYNRRYLFEQGDNILKPSRRYTRPLSVALLDIDHFKSINDRFGHKIGDDVLKQMSVLLQDTLREADLVARYGGEEFAIIMPETILENAVVACERLRKKVETYNWASIHTGLSVTISIGLSADLSVDNCEALLSHADEQLYKSKENGRNRVSYPSLM